MSELPSSAKIIIIGGGIVGCSTAYHLAKMGVTDVLLIESGRLTSGSTWHAAGLVGQLRTNANITQLLGYSVALYDKLEQETELATGWKRNGGLRLACNAERWTEVKRQATTAKSFGLEMHLLSPKEAQDLWPLMQVDDVVGAAFLPTDGQASPSDITQSLAKGARMNGATIKEGVRVTGIEVVNGVAKAVLTNKGRIEAEKIVICAGQWSRDIGKMAGVNIPLVSMQHQYLITEKIAGVTPNLPTLRDPDRLTYWKEEVGGLCMGGYEPNPKPWAQRGIPQDFEFKLLENDIDHFGPLLGLAMGRVPALETVGIRTFINGPESFTPDGNFILGAAPEVRGIYVGCGFNAFGIAAGGGAGMALAEWVTKGVPPYDLWAVDIRRFGKNHLDTNWVRERTTEAYAKHYTMAWPFEEHHSGRGLRRSPLYDKLKDQGAVFGEKLGWERPNWFATQGEEKHDIYTYGRQNWFEAVGREHKACREQAVLFDQTSFAKFSVIGTDAEKALSWICSNDISKKTPTGKATELTAEQNAASKGVSPFSDAQQSKPPLYPLTYTQMLNQRGGIECDLTVVRRSEDEFYLVTGTGFATHDLDWIRQNIPAGLDARANDVTSQYAVLVLMGPKSREILSEITDEDISNEAFPFGTMRNIHVAGAPVMALRVTYVGELGWELHLPVEFASSVYDALMRVGAPKGLSNAGYRAIESLRLEKGYRAWGADIGPDHSPLMAGLGWAVKTKKNIPFLGREAIIEQAAKPLPRMMTAFTVDDPSVVLLGRETIYRDGVRCGWLSSAGFGYTIGKNIGYGYVRNPDGVSADYVLAGSYELEVATVRVKANVSLKPLYDPEMKRIKI